MSVSGHSVPTAHSIGLVVLAHVACRHEQTPPLITRTILPSKLEPTHLQELPMLS